MEQENVDPVYKKGFEHGYWLKRGNSKDLSQLLKDSASNPDYSSGLNAGSREATREQYKEQLNQVRDGKIQSKEKDR